jgi:hypothetical protein
MISWMLAASGQEASYRRCARAFCEGSRRDSFAVIWGPRTARPTCAGELSEARDRRQGRGCKRSHAGHNRAQREEISGNRHECHDPDPCLICCPRYSR